MTDTQRLLGVNIDHVATVRQVRGVDYPDIGEAVRAAERGGADFITAHLREDRRHIQDADVPAIMAASGTWLNLECSIDPSMVEIARGCAPRTVCLVPEKREELTTEGGLDVVGDLDRVGAAAGQLKEAGIGVSLFIDPEPAQVDAAAGLGVEAIELHTGAYANGPDPDGEIARLVLAAENGRDRGLVVNLGHGLTLGNVGGILAVPHVREYNIGHSIVADAVFHGLEEAVSRMREALRL